MNRSKHQSFPPLAIETTLHGTRDRFIVCGLGSLGQHCVANLRSFGVDVTAVDLVLPSVWELPDLPNLLTEAIAGDCCQGSVVERAGARQARAILRVTESDRTVLVTEYDVTAGDTLVGKLVTEVAQGYGVVPIVYRKPGQPEQFLPTEDTVLHEGDRLVVLAMIAGLKRVERGDLAAKQWHIEIETAGSDEAAFEGAHAIARFTGCSLSVARAALKHLSAVIPIPLYQHQAHPLVRTLARCRVRAQLSHKRSP